MPHKNPQASLVNRSLPVYQQVELLIREQISSGKLAPGSKLPSTAALAKSTGTSVFTVQTALARLCREGFLDRKRRTGTFVHGQSTRLTSVGIYFGDNLWEERELQFYQAVCRSLREKLKAMNVVSRIWVDDRPHKDQTSPPRSLIQAITKSEIQAIIAPLLNSVDLPSLQKLPVPKAFLAIEEKGGFVCGGREEMLRLSLADLRDQGCRTVGIICNIQPSVKNTGAQAVNIRFYETFLELAQSYGLKTRNSWIRVPNSHPPSLEHFGYNEFNALWDLPERPEGLLVWPDVAAHGALGAAQARHVSIPDELKLVLHVNDTIPYPCSVTCTEIVTSVDEMAQALIDIVTTQIEGRPAPSVVVVPTIRHRQASRP